MTNALHNQAIDKKSPKRHLAALAVCVALGLGLSVTAQAKPTSASLRADAPHVYVVKKGDTLWDISGRFLKKPWLWPQIWANNKNVVKNPHWIYPGDRLLLCDANGRPLVGRDEGDGCTGILKRAGIPSSKLAPKVRVESLHNMIPVIPLEHIKVWLEQSAVVAPESLTNLPYVIGMPDNRVIAGEEDHIYVRGNGLKVGQRYGVYHIGQPYMLKNGDGKAYNAGVEMKQVAYGIVSKLDNDIATLELQKSFNSEVRKGDVIMVEDEATLPTLFYPVSAKQVKDGGQVVRVLDSVGIAGANSVIAIDRGSKDGVDSGYVFALEQKGSITTDPHTGKPVQLPNERSGHAMVFKTFDHISYAFVLDSERPINLGALVTPVVDEE